MSTGSPTPAPGAPSIAESVPPASAADIAGTSIQGNFALIGRQRSPLTLDPLGQAGQGIATALVAARTDAAANLYLGMKQVHESLTQLQAANAATFAPAQLIGVLLQPDGTGASFVQVQFDPASLGGSGATVNVRTEASGAFHLPMPPQLPLVVGGSVTLLIHGATSNATVKVPNSQVAANGLIGALVLPQYIAPLSVSILAALEGLASSIPGGSDPVPPLTNPPQLPVIKIGDDPDCLLAYGINSSEDRFPYGIFFRLVEPRASIVSQAHVHIVGGGKLTYLPIYEGAFAARSQSLPAASPGAVLSPGVALGAPSALPLIPPAMPGEGQVAYVDRVPVEQPISVDGFRDQMMGLQSDGTITADETRPMAGTLGIGYVLWLSQRWTFEGLALGNLVYSLPLAPGEQQQVAIFERTDTASVRETEFFTEEQTLQESALADTSTRATFDSAFREAVHGSSSFQTNSESSSWGASIIIASGGGR